MKTIQKSAEISECGLFRWWLRRRWADGPTVCFVMLNPSVADANQDDPTIRRCIAYAKAWDFGALSVRNMYPYSATKPAHLKQAMRSIDVTGGACGKAELLAARSADLVVCAWGSNASADAQQRVVSLLSPVPLWCLALTGDGKPVHPLMQRGDLEPIPFANCDGQTWREYLAARKEAGAP